MTLTVTQTRLRMADVMVLTNLSHASLYRLMKENRFPRPLRSPGRRAVYWLPEDVQAWLDAERAVAR